MHQKIYYHGTSVLASCSIAKRGFEIRDSVHGRVKGGGIYLAHAPCAAALWAHGPEDAVIIACELKSGTRILWLDGKYNLRIVRQVEKRFGKEILNSGGQFHKCIPMNKRFLGKQLEHFCNYYFHKALIKIKKRNHDVFDLWHDLSYLHEYIRRHGFDGFGGVGGEAWDDDELVVFNPSNVLPKAFHLAVYNWHPDPEKVSIINLKLGKPVSVRELEAQRTQLFMKGWYEKDEMLSNR